MEILRIVTFILRAPLHVFLVGSLGASIYAAYNKIQGISWGTPVLMGAIMIMWYFGVWMNKNMEGQ